MRGPSLSVVDRVELPQGFAEQVSQTWFYGIWNFYCVNSISSKTYYECRPYVKFWGEVRKGPEFDTLWIKDS